MEVTAYSNRKRRASSQEFSMPLITAKRQALDGSHGVQTPLTIETTKSTDRTTAARFNTKVLKKIEKALQDDPEADITAFLPINYSEMLISRKEEPQRPKSDKNPLRTLESTDSQPASTPAAFVSLELPDEQTVMLHPPSEDLENLARTLRTAGTLSDAGLHRADLQNVLHQSMIVWKSESNPSHFVAKCSPGLAVKCMSSEKDKTEFTSLLYLEQHAPDLHVPRVHGFVQCGGFAFLFMSFVPGVTLESVWPRLGPTGRSQIRGDLDEFLGRLRKLRKPDHVPIGGVANEGCKDTRRHTRISSEPIYSAHDFYSFLYGTPKWGSKVYLELLSSLSCHLENEQEQCVFTHADLHTANIIVCHDDETDACTLSGIIDWEMSGFYPPSFESIKATNVLATNEESDWFLHLPSTIAPTTSPGRWLLDRIYDKHVV